MMSAKDKIRLGAMLLLLFVLPGCSVAPTHSGRSLLQQGSKRHAEKEAAAAAGKQAAAAEGIGSSMDKLLQQTLHGKATSEGHFLTNHELQPIESIACLQAKQSNPAIECANYTKAPVLAHGAPWSGELNAGNFPNYKDPVCNSNGDFLCDPYQLLDNASRLELTTMMASLREATPISCGNMAMDPVNPVHYQPFYLGVVIAKDWPISQSGPDFMQQLGQIVSAQWNMDELYTGQTIPYLRCPTTGMLFIFPDNDQVFLSTQTCQFICQAKGGPEIATAALTQLRGKEGAFGAAMAGVRATYAYLGNNNAYGKS
jgi:hypothetical protein